LKYQKTIEKNKSHFISLKLYPAVQFNRLERADQFIYNFTHPRKEKNNSTFQDDEERMRKEKTEKTVHQSPDLTWV
jgi:hypothetical protein